MSIAFDEKRYWHAITPVETACNGRLASGMLLRDSESQGARDAAQVAKTLSLGIMRREFKDYVRLLRSGSDDEMAWLLFSACRMRLVLEAAATKLGPFPRDELNGHVLLDNEHRGNLSIYTMKLLQLPSHQSGNQSDEGDIAAAGLKAWIFSIRALHAPNLLALGREEWGELLRGADQLPLIAREFQVELAPDDPWVPEMLVPRTA